MLFVDPSPLLRQRITETQFIIAGFPNTPPLYGRSIGCLCDAFAASAPPRISLIWEESTEPGGRLGQFSHNGIVPVVETVLQLVQVRSDRRLLFSQSRLSFLGLLLRAALRPGNRPCTGEVPVPDKDGRRGGLCPPHPSKTDPPLPPFVLVQAATVFSIALEGPSGGQTKPPCQVDTGRGVLSRDRRRSQFLHLRPLFAVRLPLTRTCRLLNGRKVRSGPVR